MSVTVFISTTDDAKQASRQNYSLTTAFKNSSTLKEQADIRHSKKIRNARGKKNQTALGDWSRAVASDASNKARMRPERDGGYKRSMSGN